MHGIYKPNIENMKLKSIAAMSLLLSAIPVSAYRQTLIDDGWTFVQVNPADDAPLGLAQRVDLPHDWSIENDFDIDAAPGNEGGYLEGGKGIYRKTLDITDTSKRHILLLEGVYMNSEVKVNGKSVAVHPYGYTSYWVDVTPQVKAGKNEIEVVADNSRQKNSRWYSGSGIYRHLWHLTAPAVHVEPWGLTVTTPKVTPKGATAEMTAETVNSLSKPAKGKASFQILKDGVIVAKSAVPFTVAANGKTTVASKCNVKNPQIWDLDTPELYEGRVILETEGSEADTLSVPFGFRTIEFTTDGFKLNGRNVPVNGACVHHDHGVVGARSYDAAEARKVRLMKEAGFNTIRTSHNPPSPGFLNECDRQGMLVIDELLDGWKVCKNPHDYGVMYDEWWERDVESMVKRDRNHPSIISWSVGNEITERKSPDAVRMAGELSGKCRELDPTRPVTQALAKWDSDWEIYDPLAAQHEVIGYNYLIDLAEGDHTRVPERIIWQTESYPRDARNNWLMARDHPYIVGDIVWTGLDYIGESGIGRYYHSGDTDGESWHRIQWPWHGAYCGDVDITGHRKPISYYRSALWNNDQDLYIAVREPSGWRGEVKETMWSAWPTHECWTWPGWEGKEIEVEAVTSAPRVEVWINGAKAGATEIDQANDRHAVVKLPYTPGHLEVVALTADGQELGRKSIDTAGRPAALRMKADRDRLSNDNRDLAYAEVEVVDASGNVVPWIAVPLVFSVEGPGVLLGTGTGDLTDTRGYTRRDRQSWEGRALGVVKSTAEPGEIKIRCTSGTLTPAEVTLRSGE